jgi:hypothetical protein
VPKWRRVLRELVKAEVQDAKQRLATHDNETLTAWRNKCLDEYDEYKEASRAAWLINERTNIYSILAEEIDSE